MLLGLKLILVPVIIAAVTLAGRRWGHTIGGLLGGLPMVAGPVLFFLALEQGDAFAASAAQATLVGIAGVAMFGLVYGWVSLRATWPVSLLVSWLAFGATTVALHTVPWTPARALCVAVPSFLVARWLLPRRFRPPAPFVAPVWDLPLRIGVAVAFVLVVTGLAAWLGPRLSGGLTPFPVATAILLGFAHAQQGSAAAADWLRGFLPAMVSFVVFCFVVAVLTESRGHVVAFVAALAAQLAVQGLILALLRR